MSGNCKFHRSLETTLSLSRSQESFGSQPQRRMTGQLQSNFQRLLFQVRL
jgi:hypothetical protein